MPVYERELDEIKDMKDPEPDLKPGQGFLEEEMDYSVIVAMGRHDKDGKLIERNGELSWGILEMTESEALFLYEKIAEKLNEKWLDEWAKEKIC